MMKKILAGVLAFVMASAMASDQVLPFDDVSFQDLKPQLEQKGLLKDGRFPTIFLAQTMADIIHAQGESQVRKDLIAQAWLKHNNMSETMAGVDYDRLHKQIGYDQAFVAKVNEAGGNAAMVKTVDRVAQATPVQTPTPAVQSPVQPTDSAITEKLTSLTEKVTALEKRKEINVEAFKAELKALTETQAKATSKAEYTALAAKLTTLSGTVDSRFAEVDRKMGELTATQTQTTQQVTTLKGTVATLGTTVKEQGKTLSGVDGRLMAVEGKMGATSPLVIVALVVAAIALAFAVLRKRGGGVTEGKVAQMVEEKVVKVVGLNTAALNARLNTIEAKADTALTKTKQLAADARLVDFDAAFKSSIELLERGAPFAFWKARIDGETDARLLAFELVEPGYVKLYGVKGQTNKVSLTEKALKGAIGGATKLDRDGNCRLVGLTSAEADALEVRLAPVEAKPTFVETLSNQPETIPVQLTEQELVDKTNAALASPAFQAEAAARHEAAVSPVKAGPKVTTKTVQPLTHEGVLNMLGAREAQAS